MAMSTPRLPVIYLPHGGGPWPFVDFGNFDRGEMDSLAAYLRGIPAALATLGVQPKALLVISAHWEAAIPTVMTAAQPPMLYDYYGFPPASYQITWPAPGSPALAARVQSLLEAAGIASATDDKRGFDHGTFIPLKLSYPDAHLPTIQLSLRHDLDPEAHLALGRALAPLRDEGVLIVGSGMSFHNMRGFGNSTGQAISQEFDAWLQAAATAPQAHREAQLRAWSTAPAARKAHPREEHLLPLMVIAGAAGSDAGQVAFSGAFAGAKISAFQYG